MESHKSRPAEALERIVERMNDDETSMTLLLSPGELVERASVRVDLGSLTRDSAVSIQDYAQRLGWMPDHATWFIGPAGELVIYALNFVRAIV